MNRALRPLRRAAVASLCVGLIFGLGACSKPNTKADSYTSDVREDFMATCTENVSVDAEAGEVERTELASKRYCECVYEAVSKSQQVPIGELNDFEEKMAEGDSGDSVSLDETATGKKLEKIFKGCAQDG